MGLFLCFVFNWEGIKPRRTPDKEVKPNPIALAWVTNMLTGPNLYIEFSKEYCTVLVDPFASRKFFIWSYKVQTSDKS